MRPIRVTTETDIPTVFHVELTEEAEAREADKVDEGIAVGFPEVVSDDVECTEDENTEVPDGVESTAVTGTVDEDEVRVREGEDVKAGEIIGEVEEPIVVDRNTSSPRSGRKALVVAIES